MDHPTSTSARAPGPLGATVSVRPDGAHRAEAAALEELGYATAWVAGGQLDTLDPLAEIAAATRSIGVGSGIIATEVFDAATVAAAYAAVEAVAPGRFLVGLGGAHGPDQLRTLGAYLDELDAADPPVPASARVLAAIGPRKLELAAQRCGAAMPLLVTPEYTAKARAILGPRTGLVVAQYVVLDTDPGAARAAARVPMGFLSGVPGYPASFRRQGFADADAAGLSDRLVDALVAWGDADTVAARLREHLDAGADQVDVCLLPTASSPDPHPAWPALAHRLLADTPERTPR
jgi:probable F420-dependent oxidoreductase